MTGQFLEPSEPQPVGPEPSWNESQYVFWYDPTSGIGGVHRMAHSPNRGVAQLWTGILTAEGTRFRRSAAGAAMRAHDRDGRWSTGDLTFERKDELAVRYGEADCELELQFADFYPPYDVFGLAASVPSDDIGRVAGSAHLESSGRVTGRVRLGKRQYTVDGMGHRDHSWGPRDVTGLLSARWLVGTTGTDLSFSGTKVMTSTGRIVSAGYVARRGEVLRAVDVDIVQHTEADGLSYRGATGRFLLDDGTAVDVVLDDVVDGVVFGSDPWLTVECACRARVDGRIGVGNLESANNPFGGRAMPPSAVRACLEDGLTRRPADDTRSIT